METERELQQVRSLLLQAELTEEAAQRWLVAYAAALRVAAIVLRTRAAHRGAARLGTTHLGRGRINAWQLLGRVAPGLAEWAGYFHALQAKREVVSAGAAALVSVREADDLVRDVERFCDVVEGRFAKTSETTSCLDRSTPHRSVVPVTR